MIRLAAVLLVSLLPFASAFSHDDTDDLLKAIRKARLIDLSHAWTNSSPIASVNPPYHFSLAATHANTRCTFGDGCQLSFTSEVQNFSGQHGGPSIDALGHIGRDGKLFGGVDAATATSDPNGIGQQAGGAGANLAIDQFPQDLLVNRGVLLDVARLVNGDLTPLPARFEITAKHLQDAAKRQKVQVRRGDTVFIRTGWGQYFASASALYAGADSPGPGVDGANWLIKQGARIVGDDTLTFEQRPPLSFDAAGNVTAVFPVHMRLIADSGIFIIENLDLEGLAKAKAYEFVAVVPPLKVLGGTGSAVRIFALVGKDD